MRSRAAFGVAVPVTALDQRQEQPDPTVAFFTDTSQASEMVVVKCR